MTTIQVEETRPPDVPAMRAEVAALLVDVEVVAGLVEALTDTRQRGLGFFTHAGRQAMDDAIRAERKSHVRADARIAGLNVTAATNVVHKVGQAPTPGNLKALTTEVELWAVVRHLARRTVTHLYRRGVCAMHPLPDDATVSSIVLHLARLLPFVDDPGALQEMTREISTALQAAGEVVYGDSRIAFDEPCPHCQRRSLVAYFNRPTNDVDIDFIRCDTDPQTGHYNRCTCSDPLCECKRRPYSFRHTWYRKAGTGPDTWRGLNQRLGITRTAKRGSNE